jgi:hypothetical protein
VTVHSISQYLGHFPEGLVEFHILIDVLDCLALGQSYLFGFQLTHWFRLDAITVTHST